MGAKCSNLIRHKIQGFGRHLNADKQTYAK